MLRRGGTRPLAGPPESRAERAPEENKTKQPDAEGHDRLVWP